MPLEHPQKYGYLTLHINKLELPHAPSRLALFVASLMGSSLEALRVHLQWAQDFIQWYTCTSLCT
jgi:hypothetical protein